MNLQVITEPTQEPLTLDQLKQHLRVIHDEEDDYLQHLLIAARQWAESWTQRVFASRLLSLTLEHFDPVIYLPKPPLQSVTRIDYMDSQGELKTLSQDQYQVDQSLWAGRIFPAFGTIWPQTQAVFNAVQIEYWAGYGDAETIPAALKQAILLLVAELYERREQSTPVKFHQVPLSAEHLLAPYAITTLPCKQAHYAT